MSKFGLPTVIESDNSLPDQVMGYISVEGKASVFAAESTGLQKTAKAYHADKKDLASVRKDLEKSGFEILAESALGISVVGSPGQYEDLTGGVVQPFERLMQTRRGKREYVTCLDIVGPTQPESMGVGAVKSKSLKVDGVVLETPRQFHAVFPSPIPMNSPKFHLRLPDDVATALAALSAHRKGVHGDGVDIVMPDSGWYRHPYFTANGYKIKKPLVAVPGTNPSKDPIGHGTGESANIFAIAPGAILQPIRGTDNAGNFVGVITAFLKGKELSPKIMTNSWGGDEDYLPLGPPSKTDLALAAEIQDAIENGILVIFSAGNGQFSIEPQVPGVLAAGGVFLDQAGRLQASNYASGYQSPWFDGVIVPTVCGLVGQQPRAQYLMLPVQPGCQLDQTESVIDQDSGDPADGTNAADGWALFSGTSAAAPQVAGAAALILEAKPDLKPAQVIEALSKTAVDIVAGFSFPQRFNEPAGPGLDKATGWGLINASAAVDYALNTF
jgi:subtilisin family serine protease